MRRILIIAGLFCASWVGATDYYTSPSATGGGTGTYASPFTLQEGVDATAADDLLIVIAGTYLLTGTDNIDFDTNTGTPDAPIRISGRDATTTATEALATIVGTGLTAGQNIFDMTLISVILFDNLRLTDSPQYNVYDNGSIVSCWRDCRFDNAGSDGYYVPTTSGGRFFLRCEIDSCTATGFRGSASGRGNPSFNQSTIHDNGSHGIMAGMHGGEENMFPTLSSSLIYDNGGSGFFSNSTSNYFGVVAQNSTFWGNTGDGISLESAIGVSQITNCIMVDNGGYGINFNGDTNNYAWVERVCSYNNTSGHTDINGGVFPGAGHVLADPQFVSVVDGSEDLTPQNTNLSIERAFPAGGSDYSYIGAIQPECTGVAGGGGPLVGPGRLAR